MKQENSFTASDKSQFHLDDYNGSSTMEHLSLSLMGSQSRKSSYANFCIPNATINMITMHVHNFFQELPLSLIT